MNSEGMEDRYYFSDWGSTSYYPDSCRGCGRAIDIEDDGWCIECDEEDED